MDQKALGRTFLDIAEAIKSKIAVNLVEKNSTENMQLTEEQLREVIKVTQAAVGQVSNDALDTIIRLTTPAPPPAKKSRRKRR